MTKDLTPEPDHTGPIDPALEEWVAELGMFHASQTELTPLVGAFDAAHSFRALWHLRRCASCREQLAARIEEMLLDEEDPERAAILLTLFLQHEEPVLRASAARAAVTLSADMTGAIAPVQRLLDDPDELVRSDASISLGEIEGATRIAPLEVVVSSSREGVGLAADDRGLGALVEHWIGSLSSWALQPAVADSPLAATELTHQAMRSTLEPLFQRPILEGRLAWTKGPLRVDAFYDDSGEIRTLRAAVGTQAESSDALIVLELSDRAGATVSLTLSASQPSDLRSSPGVRGRLEHLNLRLFVADLR